MQQVTQDDKIHKFISQSVELSKIFKPHKNSDESDDSDNSDGGFTTAQETREFFKLTYPRRMNLFIDLNQENPTFLDSYYHDIDNFHRNVYHQLEFEDNVSTIILVVDIDEMVDNYCFFEDVKIDKKFIYKNGREPTKENINSIIKENKFCSIYRFDISEDNEKTITILHRPSF